MRSFWRRGDMQRPVAASASGPTQPEAVRPEPEAAPPEPEAVPPNPSATPPDPARGVLVPDLLPPEQVPLPETVEALNAEELETVRRLAEDYPDRVEPVALLGKVYKAHGNTEAAMERWQECVRLDPGFVEGYYQMGWAALHRGEYQRAVELWQQVLKLDPAKPDVHGLIARALMSLGRTQEAVEELKKDIEANPKAFHSHFRLGQTYLQEKDYEKAKQHCQTAVEIQPDFPNAYYGLATACARLGQKDEFKRNMEKFKQLESREFEVLKDRNRARDDLRFARQRVGITYTEIGEYYRQQRNLRRAETLWQRATMLDAKNPICRRYLTALFKRGGRDQEALEVYEELSRIEPENALVYAQIGMLNSRLQRFDATEKAFRKVIELAPERAEAYGWLAELLLHHNKNLPEAESLARAAVEIEPGGPAWVLLSEACRKNGNRAGAISAMEQAVQAEPENVAYQAELRRLQAEESAP
ncbi:MAG: tetratricopeptide repeat protein [Pirellulales bacterium]|nr:tetratricopeptide repeat protein [Pirellulales bacterium]